MTDDEYKGLVKSARTDFMSPFDIAYKAFCDLEMNKRDAVWFMENASEFIVDVRDKCWSEYTYYETNFTRRMLNELIDDDSISGLSPREAIISFINNNTDKIYNLTLSNTQSRRSRAGKEFESIIELLFIAADIPVQPQGVIAKDEFMQSGLGKLVDLVSPSSAEYMFDKRNVVLVSAKTTLRERWQEVPEESSRTGARDMYLATIDNTISSETLKILYDSNITVVTTKINKAKSYATSPNVITFEDLLAVAKQTLEHWRKYDYSKEQQSVLLNIANAQIERYSNCEFARNKYIALADKIKNRIQ